MVRYHGVSLSSSRSTTYISNFIETLIKSSDCEGNPSSKLFLLLIRNKLLPMSFHHLKRRELAHTRHSFPTREKYNVLYFLEARQL